MMTFKWHFDKNDDKELVEMLKPIMIMIMTIMMIMMKMIKLIWNGVIDSSNND